MCLLSYYAPGVQPNLEYLANGASVNRNGYGYAIVVPRERLIVGKSMTAARLIEEFGLLREKHPDGAALFHSRMASSGYHNVENCHPFYVGRDKLTVIAHNGMIYRGQKGEHRSDTRIFAEQVMPVWFRRLNKPTMIPAIEKYVGKYNKLAILSANPKYNAQAWLVNEKKGHWWNKEWHSNYDFLPSLTWTQDELARSYRSAGAAVGVDDPLIGDMVDGKCLICGKENSVDSLTMVCSAEDCGYCNDCLDPPGVCQCYSPSRPDSRV